jgi:hydrogenase-4 component B
MTAVSVPLTLALALCGAGALAGAIVSTRWLPTLLAWVGSLASVLAIWASADVLWGGQTFRGVLWTIRSVGTLTVRLDRLSALFLLVAAVVVLASSIFSASYLKRYAGHYSLRTFNAWYLLLCVSIAWVLVASDVFGFLVAWELMAISSYLLVNFEHQREGTAAAGYLMLVMGEAGFMAVALVLLLLASRAGSPEFSAFRAAGVGLGPGARWFVFLSSFFGFGVKAGLVPVNTWLPRAHPAAPANVSAILSGVILNLGLYGIIRVNLDLIPVSMVGAGVLLLIVGTVSALVGILYATTETDLKAVLAHSSIENIGIVTVGLGATIVFAASAREVLAGMALLAAFYHLINHSVYKALLFLGAGAVDDRAGTRDLDRLGGLIRAMPWTGGAFLVGALAISALPPFNGFVSEWLTLQTLLRSAELPSVGVRIVFALCGAGLALTAALAVTCFVRAFAMAFLGVSRSEQATRAAEVPPSAIAPLVALASLCLLLGVLPTYVIPELSRQLGPLVGAGASDALVPPFFARAPGHEALPPVFAGEFHDLGAQVGERLARGPGLVLMHRGGATNPVVFAAAPAYLLLVLGGFLVLVFVIVQVTVARRRTLVRRVVWDGGIRRLLPEMTYTATGFSNPVRVIFQAIFRPTIVEDTRETVAEHFRTAIVREADDVHVVDRLALAPARKVMLRLAHATARLHHGRLNAYVGYVLASLLVVFAAFTLF